MNAPSASPAMEALLARWRAAWPQALACWSRYTRLHEARLCATTVEAAREGLQGSFAMIRIADQSVVIDMQAVHAHGLDDYAVEILAHEIGHHVLAPGSATDHYRMLARMRRALPTLEAHAPMVANLYTDLCINDRLQRQNGLRMADVYRALARPRTDAKPNLKPKSAPGAVWSLYLRIYEHLWQLEKGSLGPQREIDNLEGDAWLGSRLVRVYANDLMAGAGRFASLLLPYLVEDKGSFGGLEALHDTRSAAAGADPSGLQEVEADEEEGAIHPARDSRITGAEDEGQGEASDARGQGAGQAREPFEYGEILKAAGCTLSPHEIAVRYYRERALPHLIPFPARQAPENPEPQFEGLEPWSIGDPIDEIDWLQSVCISPIPVPGLSTVRRTYGRDPGKRRDPAPLDLDLYVDSSGSMPDPQVDTSYLALAGAIVGLSALRAGASVQVTLWSGKDEVLATNGFVRDGDAVLGVLTGYFGGGTCFPIHRLRDTYQAGPRRRPTHILMISDDGITTMFDRDERGRSGWDVAAGALATAGGGGTMALNLRADWESGDWSWQPNLVADLRRARDAEGWDLHAIEDMADLVAFARAFSRRQYGERQESVRAGRRR